MRTNRFYEERTLDLRELWKKAGRTPPGSIQELPREGDSVNGRRIPAQQAKPQPEGQR